jgi:hypothetical protein
MVARDGAPKARNMVAQGPSAEGAEYGSQGRSAEGAEYGSQGRSAEGAEYGSQGPSAEGAEYGSQGPSAEGAEYGSQGQGRAKRVRSPWIAKIRIAGPEGRQNGGAYLSPLRGSRALLKWIQGRRGGGGGPRAPRETPPGARPPRGLVEVLTGL